MDIKVRGRRSIRSVEVPKNDILIEKEQESECDDDSVSHSSYSEDEAFISDQFHDRTQDLSYHQRCSPEKSECDQRETPPPTPKRTNILEPKGDIKNQSINTQENSNNTNIYTFVMIAFIIIVSAVGIMKISEAVVPPKQVQCDNDDTFFKTNNDIWINLKSGINEVKTFGKPSIFLYIYNTVSEDYIDDFIKKVSLYASCSLNGTDNPLELTNKELNSPKATSNYGHLIEKYSSDLDKRKVMVVKHLERVPGVVAQIFHTFCDEYNPLVKKSLFVFTMKVKELNHMKPDYKIVEDVLRKNWAELDEDIFDPLLTRISNMILRIDKEPAL